MQRSAKFDVLAGTLAAYCVDGGSIAAAIVGFDESTCAAMSLGLVCTTNDALRVCHALHWLAVPGASLATVLRRLEWEHHHPRGELIVASGCDLSALP